MGKVFVTEATVALFHNEKEDDEVDEEVEEALGDKKKKKKKPAKKKEKTDMGNYDSLFLYGTVKYKVPTQIDRLSMFKRDEEDNDFDITRRIADQVAEALVEVNIQVYKKDEKRDLDKHVKDMDSLELVGAVKDKDLLPHLYFFQTLSTKFTQLYTKGAQLGKILSLA